MADYKKDIESLEARIRENTQAIDNQITALGDALAELSSGQTEGTPFRETVDRVNQLTETMEEKQKTIDAWRELEDELSAVDDAVHQAEAEIAGKRREMEPAYESVGEAALELYQSNPSSHPELESALAGLMSIEQGIRAKERELQQLETSSKQDSFLSKTIAKGKGIVIRGTLKTRGMQKNRNLREAGEAICQGDLPDAPESSRLARELAPVRALKKDIQSLQRKKEKLLGQREEIDERKVEIEKQERMRNPAANLSHEVERLRAQAAELKQKAGREYLSAKERPSYKDERVEQAASIIQRHEKENEELTNLVRRLEAAQEVGRISEEIATHESRKVELSDRISQLDDEIEKLGSALESQKKTRGSEQSLAKAVTEALGGDTAASDG